MGFTQAIGRCFYKYADFNGRATRSEFWYFVLFYVLLIFVSMVIDISVLGHNPQDKDSVAVLTSLAVIGVLLPSLAASARRFHDVGMTGWLTLLAAIPLVGLITLYWYCKASDPGLNRFDVSAQPRVQAGNLEAEARQLKRLLAGR